MFDEHPNAIQHLVREKKNINIIEFTIWWKEKDKEKWDGSVRCLKLGSVHVSLLEIKTGKGVVVVYLQEQNKWGYF